MLDMMMFPLLALACAVISVGAVDVIDTARYNLLNYNIASVVRSGDELDVTLQFYFEHDVKTGLFENIGEGKFGLLVQPPCYMEFIKEKKTFSRIATMPEPGEFSKFCGTKLYTDKISPESKCKPDTFLELLKKGLEQSYQYEVGVFTHGSRELEKLPDVSDGKNLGIENIFTGGYLQHVPGGLYSWTGVYKHRVCSRGATGITGYYSNWVVALIAADSKNYMKQGEMVCLASDPLSAKLMLSGISKNKHITLLTCLGMGDIIKAGEDAGVLPELRVKAKFVQNPESEDKHLYEIKFKIEEQHNVENMNGDQYKLVLSSSELKKDVTKVIEIQGRTSKTFTSTYLEDSNSYELILDKREIDVGVTHAIRVDFTKVFASGATIPPQVKWNLDVFLIATVKAAKELTEAEISKMNFDCLGEDDNKEIYKNELKKWYDKVTKQGLNKITKIGSGSAVVDLSKGHVHIIMKITKKKGLFLLILYLENNPKTQNKNFTLTIRSPGKIDGEILPVNPLKPSIYELVQVPKYYNVEIKKNEMSAKLFLNDPRPADPSKKSYFEIPFAFDSNLYIDEFVKIMNRFHVKLYNEDDKIDLPVLDINVIEDLPPVDKDDKFFMELDSSLSGPYIATHDGKSTITMSIFGPIHTSMLLFVKFDEYKVSKNNISARATSRFILKNIVRHVEDSNEIVMVMDSYATWEVEDVIHVRIDFNDIGPPITDKLEIGLLSERSDYKNTIKKILRQKDDLDHNWKYVSLYEVVYMKDVLENVKETSVCISKAHRIVSSPFRNNDTGTYILARIHDCSRPWMPALVSSSDKSISLSVTHNSTQGIVGLLQTLNVKRNHTNSPEASLIKNKQFLEYTLYVMFDTHAVDSIVEQLGESKGCDSNDYTCNESYKLFTIKYFLTDFFRRYKSDLFTRVNYSYYDDKNYHITLCSLDLTTEIDHRCMTRILDVTTHKLAFEYTLDSAFAHIDPERMTESFSVVALIDEYAVKDLKETLTKYEKPEDPSSNNGRLLHPIFVNIISVGVDSAFEFSGAKSVSGLTIPSVVTEDALGDEVGERRIESDVLTNVYNGFTFEHPEEKVIDILAPSVEEKNALKGLVTHKPFQRQTRREAYEVFFGFNTNNSASREKGVAPIHRKLLEAIFHVEGVLSKAHYIFSTCASFPGIRKSVGDCKYTLSYKGTELKSFDVTSHSQATFGKEQTCDIFSIYNNVPKTLHSEL